MAARAGRSLGILVVLLLALLAAALLLRWVIHEGLYDPGPTSQGLATRAPMLATAALLAGVLFLVFRAVGTRLLRHEGHNALAGLRALETLVAVAVGLAVAVTAFGTFSATVVGLGLIGFGLTLALQRPILSMAGWAAIRFGRLFREGDRIEVEGMVGDVLEVTLFKTKLWEIGSLHSPLKWGGTISPLRQTGRVVYVSNAVFLEKPVANATSELPYIFDEFVFTVPYEGDWRLATKILHNIAKREINPEHHAAAAREYERLTQGLPISAEFPREPVVTMALETSWIELRLRYLVDVRRRSGVRTSLAQAWQEETAKHPDRLPQVYPRSQPMPVGGDGRPVETAPRESR
jgi:small-conductance mechanosensitive channel